jgi:protein-tyrosine phosphatase
LSAALDPANQPVFVHCEKGEDRTGALVAIYRIVKQGWTPERAYAEACSLGLTDWNPFMRHVIFEETEREYVHAAVVSGEE